MSLKPAGSSIPGYGLCRPRTAERGVRSTLARNRSADGRHRPILVVRPRLRRRCRTLRDILHQIGFEASQSGVDGHAPSVGISRTSRAPSRRAHFGNTRHPARQYHFSFLGGRGGPFFFFFFFLRGRNSPGTPAAENRPFGVHSDKQLNAARPTAQWRAIRRHCNSSTAAPYLRQVRDECRPACSSDIDT